MWGSNLAPLSAPFLSHAAQPAAQGPPVPPQYPPYAPVSYSNTQVVPAYPPAYQPSGPPQYHYPHQPPQYHHQHASAQISYAVPSAGAPTSDWTGGAGAPSHPTQRAPPPPQVPPHSHAASPSPNWAHGTTTSTTPAPQQPPSQTVAAGMRLARNDSNNTSSAQAMGATPPQPALAGQVRLSLALDSVSTDPVTRKTFALATTPDNPNSIIFIHQDNLRIVQPLRPEMVVNFVTVPDPANPTQRIAKDIVLESIKRKRQAATAPSLSNVTDGGAATTAVIPATAPSASAALSAPERCAEAAPLQKKIRVDSDNVTTAAVTSNGVAPADGTATTSSSSLLLSPAQQWSAFLERKQQHDIFVGSWFHQTAIPLDKPAVTDHPLGGISTVLVDVDSWNLYFSRFTDVFEQKRDDVEAALAKDYLAVARRVIVKLNAVGPPPPGSVGAAAVPTPMPPRYRQHALRRVMALALDYGAIEVAKLTRDEIRIQFTVGRSAILFSAFLSTLTRRELFEIDDSSGNGNVYAFVLAALPNKSNPQPTSLILGKRIMLPTKYMDALFVQMFDATSTDYRKTEGDFLIAFPSHEAARLALHALQRSFLSTFGLLLTYKLDDPADEPPLLLLLDQDGGASGSTEKTACGGK